MCHNWTIWMVVLLNLLASLSSTNISSTKADSTTLQISSRNTNYNSNVLTSSWAVKIPILHKNETSLLKSVEIIAEQAGLVNHGQIGGLKGHYLLVHNSTFFNHTNLEDHHLKRLRMKITDILSAHPEVEWSRQEIVRMRYKRALQFKDQYFPNQWHLNNLRFIGHDINVTGVWEHNITGKGTVVSVIDDGVEWTNPDILDNYSPEGSWDINSNDDDPMPRADDPGLNHHGTRCAGEIAAVANTYCAVGVAYGAKVSGVRILDGPMTDSLEAMAFNTKLQINDIYSCSWGPDDNGKTVDGPHQLAQAALAHGVLAGRKGYGSIFVVASGNGGHYKDNCNFDGYANSIYTVTIGAVDELGNMPYYAERCASMLAVTYSSGQGMQRNIVTTDWRLGSGTGCTDKHTGTSAAAPLAAGMIALMFQVRPCLTWRDVQHLIAYTARKHDVDEDEWFTNGAEFHHSHKYGFGLLDSWRLVNAAKVWKNVPWMTSWSSPLLTVKKYIPTSTNQIIEKYAVKRSDVPHVVTLEHVTVTVNIAHHVRGNVLVSLISPYGTPSELATARDHDRSIEGFEDWTFSTVRCWGENPVGTWQLTVTDNGEIPYGKGYLKDWKLTFYGSSMTPSEVKQRQELVESSASGAYLNSNDTDPCPPPLKGYEDENVLSERALKILLLVSGFCFLVAMYYLVDVVLDSEENKEGILIQPPRPLSPKDHRQLSEQSSCQSTVIPLSERNELVTAQSPLLPDKLIEQDKIRLSHLIEIGATRPHTPSDNSTAQKRSSTPISQPNYPIKHTPSPQDEKMRMEEFEKRLRYAMEQSLSIQAKQMSEIDALEKELGKAKQDNPGAINPEQNKKQKKTGRVKKLKGILKKPKPKKNWTP